MENKKIYYFDFLRIICAFAVIMIHISGTELFNYSVFSENWSICNLFDSLSRFAVPVFVMISGTLLLNPQKTVTFKDIFQKRIFKVVVCFVVWSVIYLAIDILKVYSPGKSLDIKVAVSSLISGHYHMWYLYLLAGLYLLTPIMRRVAADEKLLKYFLVLSAVVTFIIPIIGKIPHLDLLSENIAKMRLDMLNGMIVYYALGYYLNKTDMDRKARVFIYILGIMGAFATFLATQLISRSKGILYDGAYSYFSLTVLLCAAAVFVFGKYNLNKTFGKKTQKTVAYISSLTFGVYLVHPIFLELINEIKLFDFIDNAVFSVLTKTAVIFVLSCLLVFIIKKIPFFRKYIV